MHVVVVIMVVVFSLHAEIGGRQEYQACAAFIQEVFDDAVITEKIGVCDALKACIIKKV